MPIALIIIVIIGAVTGLLFFVFPGKQSSIDQPLDPPVEYTTTSDREADTTSTEKNTYNNGTYTANATYFTPKRVQHNISVTLTINDDVITAADVLYDDAEAKTPSHTGFDGAYEQLVLGVEIDNLDLARVGGASLTTVAFNEALADIASDASL